MNNLWEKGAIEVKNGGIVILPTDTIYGIVAKASNPVAVSRLYRIRGRNPKKSCIVLCSSIKELAGLGINADAGTKRILSKIWPNPVSVILPCNQKSFAYLHRGGKTLAVRIPKNPKLIEFIKKTGPIIAPSANPEGKPPAKNIKEAKSYFGKKVGVYISGKVSKKPSTLVKLSGVNVDIIRQGSWQVSKILTMGKTPNHKKQFTKNYKLQKTAKIK